MKYVAKKWKPELLGRNAAEVGRVNMLEYHVAQLKMSTAMPCYDPNSELETIVANARPQLAGLHKV